jgi:hypothetical protein
MLVLFDDILIHSQSWSEHLRHVHLVFTKLQEHHLFVKKSKCSFGECVVAYLGHVILAGDIEMDAQKVQAVRDWPMPHSARAVQAFLGLVGYYHWFVKDFRTIATPLTWLLCKDAFKWNIDAEAAFRALQ